MGCYSMALSTTENCRGSSVPSTIGTFVRRHAKFYAIYLGIMLIISMGYVFLAPALLENLHEPDRGIALVQIGSAWFFSLLVLSYPVFFQKTKLLKDPFKFIVGAFLVKLGIVVTLHLIGAFPGAANFNTDYEYGRKYLYGQILDQPGTESSFYYPPACSIYFVFLYLINPGQSPVLFGVQMLFFDLAVSWMIMKITRIKSLAMDGISTTNALLFYTFSAIQAFIVVLYQKFDIFVIFLSLVGIYYLLEKRWFLSAFFLVFCGFFKVYAFLWLAGILLYLLKTRKWKPFKEMLVSTLLAGGIQVGIFSLIEGLAFFENLLRFGWHFTTWEEAYNLNWSYYLKYLGVPFLNYLPPVLIVAAFLYYVIFHVKQIDFKFFINSVLILLLLYPSVNFHYAIWIVPLIGLNMTSDSSRYKRGLIAYDLVHVNLDQHVFAWLLLHDFGQYIVVDSFDPYGTPIVLVARFLIVITMLIGLFVFINWGKKGGLGRVGFQIN